MCNHGDNQSERGATRPPGWCGVRVSAVAFKLPLCTAVWGKLFCKKESVRQCPSYLTPWTYSYGYFSSCDSQLILFATASVKQWDWMTFTRLLQERIYFSVYFYTRVLSGTCSPFRSTRRERRTKNCTQFVFASKFSCFDTLYVCHLLRLFPQPHYIILRCLFQAL